MAKKIRTKAKATKTFTSQFSSNEIQVDIAEALGRDAYEDIVEIIRLKNKGAPRKLILSQLKISRSTYQRRMKLMRELLSDNPKRAGVVHAEIGKIINFYDMIKTEAMKSTGLLEECLGTDDNNPVDPAIKFRGFKVALRANNDLHKFLHSIDFFQTFKAEQIIKADKILKEHVDIEMQENIFHLMEENQKLRENLEAARRGEPEPHDDKLQDWQSIFPRPNYNTSETSEANTDFENSILFN